MKQAENLVWIDLEMTGLNPHRDVILEIATIITDSQLNILAENAPIVIHQSDLVLEGMNDWCKEHHGKSGLTQVVRESNVTVLEAEKETLDLIKKYCKPQQGILSGNSIWQDRVFLTRFMPCLVEYLHYKMVDVSSVQQLIKRWYPNNKNLEFKKQESHRALEDIRESIAELNHYREYFFIPE